MVFTPFTLMLFNFLGYISEECPFSWNDCTLMMTAHRDYIPQAIHLENVPADNLCEFFLSGECRWAHKLSLVVIDKRVQQILTRKQYIITLPLIAITCLECFFSPMQPLYS